METGLWTNRNTSSNLPRCGPVLSCPVRTWYPVLVDDPGGDVDPEEDEGHVVGQRRRRRGELDAALLKEGENKNNQQLNQNRISANTGTCTEIQWPSNFPCFHPSLHPALQSRVRIKWNFSFVRQKELEIKARLFTG